MKKTISGVCVRVTKNFSKGDRERERESERAKRRELLYITNTGTHITNR